MFEIEDLFADRDPVKEIVEKALWAAERYFPELSLEAHNCWTARQSLVADLIVGGKFKDEASKLGVVAILQQALDIVAEHHFIARELQDHMSEIAAIGVAP